MWPHVPDLAAVVSSYVGHWCTWPIFAMLSVCAGIECLCCTVPTFHFYTKCVCTPGIIHDRTPDCHPASWAWMHEWPHNWTLIAFIRKLRCSYMCMAYCLRCYPRVFVQLADIRSTGAGIKGLHCTCEWDIWTTRCECTTGSHPGITTKDCGHCDASCLSATINYSGYFTRLAKVHFTQLQIFSGRYFFLRGHFTLSSRTRLSGQTAREHVTLLVYGPIS